MADQEDWRTAAIGVDGMTCSSCSTTVENSLKKLKGIQNLMVNISTNAATLEYNAAVVKLTDIVLEIESVGFGAQVLQDNPKAPQRPISKSLSTKTVRSAVVGIDGMTCSSCTSTVENVLKNLAKNVVVNLSTNTATFEYEPNSIPLKKIVEEIESAGYDAQILQDNPVTPVRSPSKRVVSKKQSNEKVDSAVLGIDGMSCSSCTTTVRNALNKIPGIKNVVVDLSTNTATFDFNGKEVDLSLVVDEISSIGFDAQLLKQTSCNDDQDDTIEEGGVGAGNSRKTILITLDDKDIADASPAFINDKLNSLKTAFLQTAGIFGADIVFGEPQIKLVFDESVIGPRDFAKLARDVAQVSIVVSSFGGFMMANRLLQKQLKEAKKKFRVMMGAVLLSIPVVIFTMVLPMSEQTMFLSEMEVAPGLSLDGLVGFLLSFPVQFIYGYGFHKKAYQSVRLGVYGMDFLISTGDYPLLRLSSNVRVGTNAAYLYSVAGLIRGILSGMAEKNMDSNYFDTSAVLITAVLVGKYLETYAKGKTASAIHKLSSLKAKSARLVGTMSQSAYEDLEAELAQAGGASPTSAAIAQYTPIGGDQAGTEEVIDSSLLHRLDVLRLVAGESVPADGILLGNSQLGVDEAMMTGESAMVTKKDKDKVFGGTTVVEGSALMVVTACGDDSTLGKIVSTVQDAQASKPPIQELADSIARYFVPAVIFISIGTFLVWAFCAVGGVIPEEWYMDAGSPYLFAFFFALAVWVSACPCAFGLATPTAVLVATGLAAKSGVLVRRGAALQYAAEVNTMAFDKTGTLTRGCTEVSDGLFMLHEDHTALAMPFKPLGEDSAPSCDSDYQATKAELKFHQSLTKRGKYEEFLHAMRLLLAAEVRSSHPLAKGITKYCKHVLMAMGLADKVNEHPPAALPSSLPAEEDLNFDIVPGQGVHMFTVDASGGEESKGDGSAPALHVLVGSHKLLLAKGVDISADVLKIANGFRSGGKVAIFFAVNGVLRALLSVSDAVRQESVFVISALRKRGIQCYMVTGDEPLTARAIASAVGIPMQNILASAKPEDKETFIGALQHAGKRVGFVGDGTNDSPALARASAGFTMASGSEIALEAGDMVLCKNDLRALVTALELSHKTFRRIKINYIWAFGYNILLIPIACGIFYPSFQFALQPMLAGAAMALSSVSIVLSSLLLLLYKPTQIVLPNESSNKAAEKAKLASSSSDYEEVDALHGNKCDCPVSSAPLLEIPSRNIFERLFFWARDVLFGIADEPRGSASFDTHEGEEEEDAAGVQEILKRYKDSLVTGDTVDELRATEGIEMQSTASSAAGARKPFIHIGSFNNSSPKGSPRKSPQRYSSLKKGASNQSADGSVLNVIVEQHGCGCGKDNCRCGTSCQCGVIQEVTKLQK